MKDYLEQVLLNPIETGTQAEEIIGRSANGIYVLAALMFPLLVFALMLLKFTDRELLSAYDMSFGSGLFQFFILVISACFIDRKKSRVLAGFLFLFFSFQLFYDSFLSLFIEPEALNDEIVVIIRYISWSHSAAGNLAAFGALRGTIRFHRLVRGEG